jgi:hypothetical protein
MRLSGVIAALLVAAPLGLCVSFASAQPLPQAFQGQSIWGGRPNTPGAAWCSNLNSGADRVEEDCSFNSFAACQRALGNVNNGFCTQNYAYAGPPPAPPRKKKRRVQR